MSLDTRINQYLDMFGLFSFCWHRYAIQNAWILFNLQSLDIKWILFTFFWEKDKELKYNIIITYGLYLEMIKTTESLYMILLVYKYIY
jgi:hypothetical protein